MNRAESHQAREDAQGQSETRATQDHTEIKEWVESLDGRPAVVTGTRGERGTGILRIDFPAGAGEEELSPISWDEFFAEFDRRDLHFLYQASTDTGETSYFCKFVNNDGDAS